jgi:hypothetical protein
MSSGYDSDMETIVTPLIEDIVIVISVTASMTVCVNALCYKFTQRTDKLTLVWWVTCPGAQTYTHFEHDVVPALPPDVPLHALLSRKHRAALGTSMMSVIRLPANLNGECPDTTKIRLIFDHLCMTDAEIHEVSGPYTPQQYRELLITVVKNLSE